MDRKTYQHSKICIAFRSNELDDSELTLLLAKFLVLQLIYRK
jgi:hypothetical protein